MRVTAARTGMTNVPGNDASEIRSIDVHAPGAKNEFERYAGVFP